MPSAERGGAAQPTLRALLRRAVRRLKAARVAYGHGTTNANDEAAGSRCTRCDSPWMSWNPTRAPAQCCGTRTIETLIDERIRTRKPAAI